MFVGQLMFVGIADVCVCGIADVCRIACMGNMEGITRPLRASMPKNIGKSSKNCPQTLQNGGLGPPKSSPEPSKTPILNDT